MVKTLWGKLDTIVGDIRSVQDLNKVKEAFTSADLILHLAAQVAVTTSVTNPREDLTSNALGTFNILETMRLSGSKAKFIYSSTNKVYGGMEDVTVIEEATLCIQRSSILGSVRKGD